MTTDDDAASEMKQVKYQLRISELGKHPTQVFPVTNEAFSPIGPLLEQRGAETAVAEGQRIPTTKRVYDAESPGVSKRRQVATHHVIVVWEGLQRRDGMKSSQPWKELVCSRTMAGLWRQKSCDG